jgi:fructokinase
MNKILCIGEALIDMICTDKGSDLSDGENFLKTPGGAPTNVAAAIAALGGDAWLAAKVGADPFGRHLINVMHDFGVSTKFVVEDKKHFTTFAFVSLLENGERDFYFNRGADGELTRDEVDIIELSEFPMVHFGSATGFLPGALQIAYQMLLQKALFRKVYVSFDPNYRQLLFGDNTQSFIDQSWSFLTACHFFKVSDEEAMLLTGRSTVTDAASDFIQKTKAVFAITLGKNGTLLGLNGTTVIIPSIPVQAVDTTGAGDAFVGAVLYQLSKYTKTETENLQITDWHQIITNANKAGARTCEYLGAMEAFKHLNKDIFN